MFTEVDGTFYRSIDPFFRSQALAGSVRPGRYSRDGQPTLYLSASPEGVAAAIKAHTVPGDPQRVLVSIGVKASGIFDLRDQDACAEAGIDPGRAFLPWQDVVRQGGSAPSWQIADTLRDLGANELIDPSRTAPGLWHLVLFRWNVPDGAKVRLLDV